MTPEQIENWRRLLSSMIGPYARIMPEEQIEEMKGLFQARIDALPEPKEEEPFPFNEGDVVQVGHRGKAYIKRIQRPNVTVKWAWGGTDLVPMDQIEPYEKAK